MLSADQSRVSLPEASGLQGIASVYSGEKTAKLVTGARLAAIKDGPHAVNWTHADEVNAELVNFLGKGAAKRASARSSR